MDNSRRLKVGKPRLTHLGRAPDDAGQLRPVAKIELTAPDGSTQSIEREMDLRHLRSRATLIDYLLAAGYVVSDDADWLAELAAAVRTGEARLLEKAQQAAAAAVAGEVADGQ